MAVTSKVFLLFSIFWISFCYSNAKNLTTWGDCDNYVLVGRNHVFEKPHFIRPRTRVIKFPPVGHTYITIINDVLFNRSTTHILSCVYMIVGISSAKFHNQRYKSH